MPRPQLDHYVGQTVTEVSEGDGEPDVWNLHLDGGAVISNTDKRRKKIPAVVGMVINTVVMSETETEILFGPTEDKGTERLPLSPDKYRIHEPTWEAGPVYPQLPDEMSAEATLPPDPSEERTDHPLPPREGEPQEPGVPVEVTGEAGELTESDSKATNGS